MNIGKWVLRNLFYNFIKEQQRTVSRRNRELASQENSHRIQRGSAPTHIDIDPHTSVLRRRSSSGASRTSREATTHNSPKSPTVVTSPSLVPATSPFVSITGRSLTSTPTLTPAGLSKEHSTLSPIPQSPAVSNDATPMPRVIQRSSTTDGNNISASSPSPTNHNDYFSLRGRRPSMSGQVATPDDFSGWSGPGSHKSGGIAINTQAASPGSEAPQTPNTPSGHGLMGRLRAFGKVAKRQASEIGTASTSSTAVGSETPAPVGVSFTYFC